jgi:hypothetical protein
MRARLAILAVALAGVALAATPAAAGAKTVWLCRPGASPNPCHERLDTTVTSIGGATQVVRPGNARRPRIDCFYVYPTVSEQPGPNSDRSIDPQQTAIAEYQAARYSQRCRVFAPVYRQLTLSAVFGPSIEDSAVRLAYSDVRRAWLTYLRRYNHGRGFVLIGHSQGTGMLRQLIRRQIDRRPKVRRRLVSAILLGGNVTVRKGRKIGGDFRHVPGCRRRKQTGCAIAFSTFGETPPDDSVFGRADNGFSSAFGLPGGPAYRVLCTNPAALGGGSGPLRSLLRSEPFPGTLGAGITLMYGGPAPTAPTPWLVPQDHYRGRCVHANGADVLLISPIGSARHLTPSPDATWGLHLADANIALGNLVSVVGAETRAYLRRAGRRRRAARRHRH